MNKARIFISYAREDIKQVRSLHQRLKDAGYDPWMDKVDLLAGRKWQLQIEQAIQTADFFVLCLSNNSVKKRGFVQREIKYALDLWQEKLEDDIYLIPVMLESLNHKEVPDEIRKIHWVELYEEEGWAQLIRALEYGVGQRRITGKESPAAEVEEKKGSNTGEAARDKSPAPIPPPAQPVRPAPWQQTPEQTAPPPVVAPPIADKSPTTSSPPAGRSQPETQRPSLPPPDDARKVVKLAGMYQSPPLKKSRPVVTDPKPTWWLKSLIAQAREFPKARLIGLGLALPAIALLAWLLWNSASSTKDKAASSTSPASAGPSSSPSPVGSAAPEIEMVYVTGGSFLMGSPENETDRDSDEEPQRRVTVPSFSIGKYEVTQAQWRAVMGSNPSSFKGDNLPVENVSWNDAKEFCRKLSQMTGKEYRLPTEAEWEYACRAGTTTPFAFGSSLSSEQANFDGNYPYGGAPKGIYRKKQCRSGALRPMLSSSTTCTATFGNGARMCGMTTTAGGQRTAQLG